MSDTSKHAKPYIPFTFLFFSALTAITLLPKDAVDHALVAILPNKDWIGLLPLWGEPVATAITHVFEKSSDVDAEKVTRNWTVIVLFVYAILVGLLGFLARVFHENFVKTLIAVSFICGVAAIIVIQRLDPEDRLEQYAIVAGVSVTIILVFMMANGTRAVIKWWLDNDPSAASSRAASYSLSASLALVGLCAIITLILAYLFTFELFQRGLKATGWQSFNLNGGKGRAILDWGYIHPPTFAAFGVILGYLFYSSRWIGQRFGAKAQSHGLALILAAFYAALLSVYAWVSFPSGMYQLSLLEQNWGLAANWLAIGHMILLPFGLVAAVWCLDQRMNSFSVSGNGLWWPTVSMFKLIVRFTLVVSAAFALIYVPLTLVNYWAVPADKRQWQDLLLFILYGGVGATIGLGLALLFYARRLLPWAVRDDLTKSLG